MFSVDLVTLDDLSAEAMLESSQRVEQLADLFRRRVEPLPDPGPPQPLPGKPRTAIVPIQVVAIILYDLPNLYFIAICATVQPLNWCFLIVYRRHMAYSQPRNILRWISRIFIAGILSIIIGSIFWNIPQTDSTFLNGDRYKTLIQF